MVAPPVQPVIERTPPAPSRDDEKDLTKLVQPDVDRPVTNPDEPVKPTEPEPEPDESDTAGTVGKPDDPEKPPQVYPNTYWGRKGSGWVLEYKRKVNHQWEYEYYGLLEMEQWLNLKGVYNEQTLVNIIKGIVAVSKGSKRKSTSNSQTRKHSLRVVR